MGVVGESRGGNPVGWRALVQRPLLAPVAAAVTGALLGVWVPAPAWLLLAVAALSWALARDGKTLSYLALLAGAVGVFGLAGSLAADTRGPPPRLREPVRLLGRVLEVAPGEGRSRVLLDVEAADGSPVRYRVGLLVEGPTPPTPGQRVALRTRLKPVVPALNPGEADFSARLRRRGQLAQGHVAAGDWAPLTPAGPLASLWPARLRVRDAARAVAPDAPSAALFVTLAAGLRSELDAGLEADFAASGLAHLLSVSGLHVAVLAAVLAFALRRALVWWPGRALHRLPHGAVSGLASTPLVWGYVAFTGWQAPAVRSALMCSALLLAPLAGRAPDVLNAVALALGLMVLVDPSSLQDLSLQLSFAATLALVLLAPRLRAGLPGTSSLPPLLRSTVEPVAQTLAASLAVTLATAPLVLGAFQRVSLAGLLANVAVLPLSGALTVSAAVGAALALAAPPLAFPVLWLGTRLSALVVWLAQGFAAAPLAQVESKAPSTTVALVWFLGLSALTLASGRGRWVGLLAPLALAMHLWPVRWPPGVVEVTFLGVGHGDAVVVSSQGQHALIDGGGVPEGADVGRRQVLPFLRHKGIEALRLAALTHAHPDHALGLISTLEALPVERLWIPAGVTEGPLVEALREAADDAVQETVERGAPPLTLGAATLEVLGPPRDRVLLESENDRSLVLLVRHGAISLLLTGDVEAAGEEVLEVGPVTVVKAPHHGSRSSSTPGLVGATRPRFVVFCVGAANRYGFPHPEVVRRWEAAGARCYRTDQHGAVTFRSDGREVTVETFLGG